MPLGYGVAWNLFFEQKKSFYDQMDKHQATILMKIDLTNVMPPK